MKIYKLDHQDITHRLEEFAKRLNQTAQQVVIQDPQAFAEHIRKKGSELLSILKATLFREKARVIRPEFLRARIKRRVIDNLDEDFQYPEVVDVVTDSLVQAAKEDPRYRRMLGLDSYPNRY